MSITLNVLNCVYHVYWLAHIHMGYCLKSSQAIT